jgi:hypothetical protein
MMKKGLLAVSILGALLAFGSQASADPIGGLDSDCVTCQGSIYTLSYSGTPLSSDATTETFRISLDIDTTNYNGGGLFIDAVAIKVSPTSTATLFAAPGGTGLWTLGPGGISAIGCDGSGGGFQCADLNSVSDPAVAVPTSTILTWTFDVTVPTGTLTPLTSVIKARYVDGTFDPDHPQQSKVGALVSEDITLQTKVPEPATLMLLGAGLAGIGLSQWKRRKAGQA